MPSSTVVIGDVIARFNVCEDNQPYIRHHFKYVLVNRYTEK